MKLFINGETHHTQDCEPEISLLRYLRTSAAQVGTKEGCGSGDCGACTVLVSDADGTNVHSVNACITPLGSVQHKQVTTVEGLTQRGALHPVQQAMVDQHGSQCGFCTPGFIMSLAGLYHTHAENQDPVNRDQITAAIAGNLCRCTGYRPIIAAGLAMQDYPARAVIAQAATHIGAETAEDDLLPVLETEGRQFYQPKSETALQALMQRFPDASLVAGATDFGLEISQNYRQFEQLIDILQIETLAGVSSDEGWLRIGAATPYSDLISDPRLAFVEFREILSRLGSVQIRHRGTVGGNLANGSPIADTPPMLLCWDARVEICCAEGTVRELELSDFFLDYRQTALAPNEYIRALRMPLTSLQRPHRFAKLSKRFEDDISSVMMAVSIAWDGHVVREARIAYGGMAAIPVRASSAEQNLLGQSLNATTIDNACSEIGRLFTPLSDVRASADYRTAMAINLLRRALQELNGDPAVSVYHPAEVQHA